jgi:hypothetical protein
MMSPLAIGNRKSAIAAIFGQAAIAETLRKKQRGLELLLQGGYRNEWEQRVIASWDWNCCARDIPIDRVGASSRSD